LIAARRSVIKDWPSEIIDEAPYIAIVLLADVFLQFLIGFPRYVPGGSPWLRVCAGIVDRGFKMQRVFVRTRQSFYDVEQVCMRMTRTVDPRSFIETYRVDHECIAFPMPDRMTDPGLAFDGVRRRMRTPIHEHFSPYVRPALKDHDDS